MARRAPVARARKAKKKKLAGPTRPKPPGPAQWTRLDDRPEVIALFANLVAALPTLLDIQARCNAHWGAEDGVYRFYHQSLKVYGRLQPLTVEIVAALSRLAPERKLNAYFVQIVAEGTGKTFTLDDNDRWLKVTRPIVEAFFHARYFLDMACKYGQKLDAPRMSLPSGWASVLYLYGLR